jgi:hypothetical protein
MDSGSESGMTVGFFLPPFKPSAKWCSYQGEMAWMPFQARSCWEHVWADPDMGAILTIKGLVRGGIFSSLFVAVDKKGLAHLLSTCYRVRIYLVCETMLIHPILCNLAGNRNGTNRR